MSQCCRVCNDIKASKHYGSYCCNGCKGFFRRTLISQRGYNCRYLKKCAVTAGKFGFLFDNQIVAFIEDRNCCPACRFDKCFAAGLDPYMIHDSRGLNMKTKLRMGKKLKQIKKLNEEDDLDNSTTKKSLKLKENHEKRYYYSSKKMYHANRNPLGALKLVEPFVKTNMSSVIEYYKNIFRLCDKFVDSDGNHLTFSKNTFFANITVLQALSEPGIICPRTKINWTDNVLVNFAFLRQGWCRSFVNYIDWVSHIPELQQLTLDDQIRLVMDRGTSCMNILAGYRAFQNNIYGIPFSGGAYLPRDECQQKQIEPEFCPMFIEYANFLFDEITVPMKQMSLTPTEFCILRLLVFLTPVPGLSLHGKEITKEANKFYRKILIQHIKEEDISVENCLSRIGDIFKLLFATEISSLYCDRGYTMMILFNIANMKGELPYEFHIRKGFKG